MTIDIRLVQPDEFAAVGDLTVAAYAALEGDVDDVHTSEMRTYEAELRDVASRAADAVVLVAVEGDEVLGAVTYVPGPGPMSEWDDPEAAGIRMLAVEPGAQGRGVGGRLVDACVDRARADGRARILLHTTPWMTVAHGVYERRGFVRDVALDWDPSVFPLLGYRLEL